MLRHTKLLSFESVFIDDKDDVAFSRSSTELIEIPGLNEGPVTDLNLADSLGFVSAGEERERARQRQTKTIPKDFIANWASTRVAAMPGLMMNSSAATGSGGGGPQLAGPNSVSTDVAMAMMAAAAAAAAAAASVSHLPPRYPRSSGGPSHSQPPVSPPTHQQHPSHSHPTLSTSLPIPSSQTTPSKLPPSSGHSPQAPAPATIQPPSPAQPSQPPQPVGYRDRLPEPPPDRGFREKQLPLVPEFLHQERREEGFPLRRPDEREHDFYNGADADYRNQRPLPEYPPQNRRHPGPPPPFRDDWESSGRFEDVRSRPYPPELRETYRNSTDRDERYHPFSDEDWRDRWRNGDAPRPPRPHHDSGYSRSGPPPEPPYRQQGPPPPSHSHPQIHFRNDTSPLSGPPPPPSSSVSHSRHFGHFPPEPHGPGGGGLPPGFSGPGPQKRPLPPDHHPNKFQRNAPGAPGPRWSDSDW
ncbi:unnamed protein product [Protopolystoma xenopodis]|uniref:Uncharacterized protein n=1 Tax=Protopolystoma xenopodis TaxID=117903 RepID=A0A3S5FBV7_9PLAT|nr:unnamed protein product [Protopolystoma xenopodis]